MSARAWNRRETSVAQAGYFSILRSTGWFSALSRLPGGYRYVVKGPATPDFLVRPEGLGVAATERRGAMAATAPAFQAVAPRASGRAAIRFALIAFVAAGITVLFFLLLHLESPGGPFRVGF